jgi:uncharacterized protein involved in outer membrane biogenesis
MKKRLLWIGGILAIVAITAIACVDLFVGSFVKRAVDGYGPAYTQTRVSLDGAQLSPFSGSGTLTGLYVGNPKGWSSDKALTLGSVHIQIAPRSLLSNHVIIEELTIDRPEFVYETRLVASNIGELLKNIQKASSSPGAAPQASHDGQTITFEVKHFHLTNGKVTVGVGPSAVTIPMGSITLDNLGDQTRGVTSAQLAAAIFRSITPKIAEAAAGATAKFVPAAALDTLKTAGGTIQSLFGGK